MSADGHSSRHAKRRVDELDGSEHQPPVALAVIGMSAGATQPLRAFLQALPLGFPGVLVLARHASAQVLLPDLIRYWTRHEVLEAFSGSPLQQSVIHVCPGDRHIVVNPDATLTLSQRERVEFVRPSIDWLFESAAGAYGERASAIVLSGANRDGARGAACVQRARGVVLIQAPHTCEFPQMPLAAARAATVSAQLTPEELAVVLMERMTTVTRQFPNAWAEPFESDMASTP